MKLLINDLRRFQIHWTGQREKDERRMLLVKGKIMQQRQVFICNEKEGNIC